MTAWATERFVIPWRAQACCSRDAFIWFGGDQSSTVEAGFHASERSDQPASFVSGKCPRNRKRNAETHEAG